MRFAVIEPSGVDVTRPARIEITLPGGGHIRIGEGADAATVRLVLAALRTTP